MRISTVGILSVWCITIGISTVEVFGTVGVFPLLEFCCLSSTFEAEFLHWRSAQIIVPQIESPDLVQIEHIRRFVMEIFPSLGIPRLTQTQEKMTKFETKEEGKGSLIHSLLELILVSRQSTSKRCKSMNYWAVVDWQCFPPGPQLTTCSNLPTVWLFESPT